MVECCPFHHQIPEVLQLQEGFSFENLVAWQISIDELACNLI